MVGIGGDGVAQVPECSLVRSSGLGVDKLSLSCTGEMIPASHLLGGMVSYPPLSFRCGSAALQILVGRQNVVLDELLLDIRIGGIRGSERLLPSLGERIVGDGRLSPQV
jgi:hypothetical protein